MKLEKARTVLEIRNYILLQNGSNDSSEFIQKLQSYQHFYFIIENNAKIGLIEIHYLHGRDDALVNSVFIEPVHNNKENLIEVYSLAEEKARDFGAKILTLNYADDNLELMKKKGWTVESTVYTMSKIL